MKSVYEICFYGGLILAILLFITAVVLFIVLKIPKVFGDLTGRNAKKSMKNMKEGAVHDNSISKKEQAKYYNQGTGKITVREAVSEEKRKANRDNTTDTLRKTSILKRKKLEEETELLTDSSNEGLAGEETEVLSANDGVASTKEYSFDEKTDVLRNTDDEDATDVLKGADDEDATDVLKGADDEDATDVLKGTDDEDATDVLKGTDDEDATDVLKGTDDDATDVLRGVDDEDATDVLRGVDDEDATDVLRSGSDEEDGDSTTVLTSPMADKLSRRVKVIYNIIEVHTEESL